jgi:hypothetical protein
MLGGWRTLSSFASSSRLAEWSMEPDRYIYKEKKRGKALDAVTNFHVRNGAVSCCVDRVDQCRSAFPSNFLNV